ncbi:MAG: GCN5-related N-acetyltransferase [Frankiales bacterium]|nr:GCN5-related N-acetyltransferase [Frankiales bacterium]
MSPLLVEWDRAELGARVEEVLDVYAEAMEVSRSAARARRSVVAAHLDRRGLRAVAALDGEQLVGIGYGYRGAPGQWWHDQVRAAMDPELANRWLQDAFEVCELHVRPRLHGSGLGRDILLTLLSGTEAATAVLTTPDLETRARRFYRAGGWVDLVRNLTFPGDPRTFAVLGLDL